MKIPASGNTPTHLQLVRDPAATPPARGGDVPAASTEERPATPRTDSVQLSLAGRALAKADPMNARTALSPERILELRQKVLDGAYDTLEAVDAIAQGIIDRGDLG